MDVEKSQQIQQLVAAAKTICIVQADNPDADSLGSALALEQILGEMGKDVVLYCGVDIPTYLRYMQGWDRVQAEFPKSYDVAIIVDASTYTLFGQLDKNGCMATLRSKPTIVLDHHTTVENVLDFVQVSIIDAAAASAGEVIYDLAKANGWRLDTRAAEHIMSTILGDTQGLTNDRTTSRTYRIMGELTDLGANRPYLEDLRREYSRMPTSIFRYKGELIERMQFTASNRIAHVTIPQQEINDYSPLYNPAVLVQYDSLQVTDVAISIVFKIYDDGKITAKLRCNLQAPIANKLAEHFGGGGHPHSAGFKITDGKDFDAIKVECLSVTTELLDSLAEDTHETL